MKNVLIASLVMIGSLVAYAQLELPQVVPFQYFGRVLDAGGLPVQGASAEFQVYKYEGSTSIIVSADVDGNFDLETEALTLRVFVVKDGYWSSETKAYTLASFDSVPTNAIPTALNPEVFVITPRNPAPGLVKISTRYRSLTMNGSPVYFDFDDPQNVSPTDWDMMVSVSGSPEAPNSEGKFDWQLSVIVPSGGLVLRDEKDWVAPHAGYISPLVMTFDKSDENWNSAASPSFFVNKDGIYARIDLIVVVDERAGPSVRISSGFLDPNGGRNLER